MSSGQPKDTVTFCDAGRHAGRILKSWVGADQAWPVPRQMILKRSDIHAVGFEWHFEDTRPDASQCVDHAIVRGTLDDHRRSVRNQQPDDKLDRLLRSRGHDYIVWRRRHPLLGKVFDDRAAKTDAPIRRVVDEIW